MKPSDCKTIRNTEKEEILMDAIDKTITNTSMEYELTYQQVIGCLETIKEEYRDRYKER